MSSLNQPWGRKSLVVVLGGTVLLLALGFAGVSKMIIGGIIGAVAVAPLVLYFPVWSVILGLASGPTTGGWLDYTGGGALPAVTLDRVFIASLVVYVGLRWLRRPSSVLPITRTEILMAGFILVATISLVVNGGSQPIEGVKSGFRTDFIMLIQSYAMPYIWFFLAKNFIRDPQQMKRVLWVYAAIGVFVGAVAILQYYTNISFFTATRYRSIHTDRAVGTLRSAAHLGMVMDISLLAAVILLVRSRQVPARLISLGAMCLMLVALFLSKTRAAYVGFAWSLVVVAYYSPRFRRGVIVTGLIAVVVLMAAWPVLSQTDFVKGRLLDKTPLYNRIALWATAANMIVHRPIDGYGFSRWAFVENRSEYLIDAFGVSSYWAHSLGVPHNEYLHIPILVGLLGFVPYLLILARCWRTTSRFCARGDRIGTSENSLVLVTIGSFGMYLLSGFFTDFIGAWYGNMMVFFLLGVVEGMRIRGNESTQPRGPAVSRPGRPLEPRRLHSS